MWNGLLLLVIMRSTAKPVTMGHLLGSRNLIVFAWICDHSFRFHNINMPLQLTSWNLDVQISVTLSKTVLYAPYSSTYVSLWINPHNLLYNANSTLNAYDIISLSICQGDRPHTLVGMSGIIVITNHDSIHSCGKLTVVWKHYGIINNINYTMVSRYLSYPPHMMRVHSSCYMNVRFGGCQTWI